MKIIFIVQLKISIAIFFIVILHLYYIYEKLNDQTIFFIQQKIIHFIL